jgi:hypothetical protein
MIKVQKDLFTVSHDLNTCFVWQLNCLKDDLASAIKVIFDPSVPTYQLIWEWLLKTKFMTTFLGKIMLDRYQKREFEKISFFVYVI